MIIVVQFYSPLETGPQRCLIWLTLVGQVSHAWSSLVQTIELWCTPWVAYHQPSPVPMWHSSLCEWVRMPVVKRDPILVLSRRHQFGVWNSLIQVVWSHAGWPWLNLPIVKQLQCDKWNCMWHQWWGDQQSQQGFPTTVVAEYHSCMWHDLNNCMVWWFLHGFHQCLYECSSWVKWIKRWTYQDTLAFLLKDPQGQCDMGDWGCDWGRWDSPTATGQSAHLTKSPQLQHV